MDLAIVPYNHDTDFVRLYPLFRDYHLQVNGSAEEGLVTALIGEKLEAWVEGLSCRIKVAYNLSTASTIGFIAYYTPDKDHNSAIYVEALYISPEVRYNGITRSFLASFPGVEHIRFALHKSRRESKEKDPMLSGLLNAVKVGEHPTNNRLEVWQYRIDHSRAFGTNKAMTPLKSIGAR
jgi:hypothetical protein